MRWIYQKVNRHFRPSPPHWPLPSWPPGWPHRHAWCWATPWLPGVNQENMGILEWFYGDFMGFNEDLLGFHIDFTGFNQLQPRKLGVWGLKNGWYEAQHESVSWRKKLLPQIAMAILSSWYEYNSSLKVDPANEIRQFLSLKRWQLNSKDFDVVKTAFLCPIFLMFGDPK